MRTSIIEPRAFIERIGDEPGSIGGTKEYSAAMPAWGPGKDPPRDLTEQQLADLVAFIEQGGEL